MLNYRARLSATAHNPTLLALAIVLIVALALRLFNLDWDQGQYLHPDERFIADVSTSRIIIEFPPDWSNLLDPERSRLNPRSVDPNTGRPRDFSYGALPLIVTDLVGATLTKLTGDNWSTYSGNLYKTGRFLSALFDTLTVLMVFLIGRRVAGERAGLCAALIAALTPMAIQLSHFFTTDAWLTFFVSLTIWLSIAAIDDGRRRWFVAAGAGFGLAMATKGSVFTLGALVAVAILLALWQRRRELGSTAERVAWAAERALLAGIASIAAFALFEPYALVRPGTYVDQLLTQSRIIRGTFDVPFTRQYIGTTPILYQIEQVVKWGYGPVAGILIGIGALTLGRRSFRRPDPAGLLLIAWFVGYGIVVALPETKFLRYLAPLIPVFAVLGGLAIDATAGWLSRRGRPRLATFAPALLLIGVGLSAAAFLSVYNTTNPRISASEWIYANVPPGSILSAEYWDDSLPLDLSPALNPAAYNYSWVSFNLYHDPPAEEAAATIYDNLARVDYIVISSNRVMSAMPQSPWRYPVQIDYYRLLLEEKLGFELVAEFQTTPKLGSLAFDDRNADESFINYDHPRVLIFKKARDLPREEYDALMSAAVAQPVTPARHANHQSILLEEPVGALPVVDDARWSASWTGNSLVALIWWIGFILILQVAGLPIALLAFRRFADRGWAFARLTSLLVAGWLVWILASLEVVTFRAIWIWIALALLTGLWLVRGRRPIAIGRDAWRDRATRRTILVGESVFWATFALFLLFRYLNPDSWHMYWGGEKPMEFAHLNAILRSAHFPPYDPWFSDGYLNYYYYGIYLVAVAMKATGIPSEIAFNLAQPTVIALLALAGYGVTATLGRAIARRSSAGPVIGVAGAIVLVLIGNLTATAKIVETLPDRVAPDFIGWFWGGSRVVTVPDPFFGDTQQITEFPYFTALFADLHAHVVAMPITVLAVAIGLALAKESRSLLVSAERRSIGAAAPAIGLAMFAALVIGSLFPTNAWDFFTYAAFVLGSLFVALRRLEVKARLTATVVVGGITIGLGYLLYLPFHTNFVALFSEIKPSEIRTDLWQFSTHFGGLLLLTLVGLIALVWTRMSPQRVSLSPAHAAIGSIAFLAILGLLARFTSFDRELLAAMLVIGFGGLALATGAWWKASDAIPWNRHLMAIGGIVSFGLVIADRLVLALCLALSFMAAAVFFGIPGSSEKIVALMATAGFAIPAMVEIIYVVDDLDGGPWERMNTMFKFYNQAWVLLALAGGTLTGWLIFEAIGKPGVAHIRERELSFSPNGPVLLAMGVIVASLAYPLTATLPRLEERFAPTLGSGTLNALDWMSYTRLSLPGGHVVSFEDDLAAIEWFNNNVPGSPVIVEASFGPYRGNGSRVSIATGLPSVLGWDRHERQQRYSADVSRRYEDVRAFFRTESTQEKRDFLARYNVAYVIVGDLERYAVVGENPENPYSTPEGIAAIEAMVGNGLEIAFQHGTTTVYRVVPPESAS